MERDERDRQLLGLLDSGARALLEELLDDMIDDVLPSADAATLVSAASAFDLRAQTLPAEVKTMAMQIAAALRQRGRGSNLLN